MAEPGSESQLALPSTHIHQLFNSASPLPYQPGIDGSSVQPPIAAEPTSMAIPPDAVTAIMPSVAMPIQPPRKRGRPRKYGPDSNVTQASTVPSAAATPTARRGRGRPLGSGKKKQQLQLPPMRKLSNDFIN